MTDASFSILVFEDQPEHIRHLKKMLQSGGTELVFEDHVYEVTRRFKTAPFDLSIVSLDMPDDEGEELVWWLLENFPRRPILLVGDELFPEQEELLAYKSVLGFFSRPLQPEALDSLLHQSQSGLRGQVQRMQIPDLLQALRWSQSAVILQFMDDNTQQEGWLYLQNGEIVHAEVHRRSATTNARQLMSSGSEAFAQILHFRNGSFTEQIWQEPAERSIQLPFDGLMMGATTRKDEQAASVIEGEEARIRRALLIDDDAMSRMMLQRALLMEGIDCLSLRSLDEAHDWFSRETTDLLILDASLPASEVSFLLETVAKRAPNCSVLLLGHSPSLQGHAVQRRHILPRPISPKKLKEALFDLTQVGFRGYLSRIGVLDFLQLNLSAIDESKKLHIRDLSNRVDGQIYIDRGRFIHAEFGDLVGEEAFYRIAAIETGDFFEDPSFQPPATSLAEVMPHKLMINANQYARPVETLPASPPESALAEAPVLEAADFQAQPLLGASMSESLDSLFGDFDDSPFTFEPSAPEAAAPPPRFTADSGGGLTSLFDDEERDGLSLPFK
ncbi:MAG: DUF4388 domain-containing protein [Candidatus Sericytochromatia bacterium]